MVLQQKLLEKADFIVTITGPVMVRPASSDKWKAPLNTISADKSDKQYRLASSHMLFIIIEEKRTIEMPTESYR